MNRKIVVYQENTEVREPETGGNPNGPSYYVESDTSTTEWLNSYRAEIQMPDNNPWGYRVRAAFSGVTPNDAVSKIVNFIGSDEVIDVEFSSRYRKPKTITVVNRSENILAAITVLCGWLPGSQSEIDKLYASISI